MKIPDHLNRFTSLPILLHALKTKQLALRSPEQWDDKNDSHYLERYQEEMEFKTLRALCFNLSRERYHHWKCFADGSSGVCMEFRRAALLARIKGLPGFVAGKVSYRLIDTVAAKRPPLETWPFLKRKPFKDEWEFRILYQSETESDEAAHIKFRISDIRRITLSPWLSKEISKTVAQTIRALPDCAGLKINRSTLLQNARWRKAIRKTKKHPRTPS
jgi:hypothetical protein